MKTFLTSLLLLVYLFTQAQTAPPAVVTNDTTGAKKDTNAVLAFAEIMPSFPGGEKAFQDYLRENIVYPADEKRNGKDGIVYISFVINKDGSVDSVRIRKGVPGAPALGEEAARVIREMPAWTPGKINQRPVRVEMTVPIRFTLTGRKKKRNH